ncbi:MAG: neutral zinc metallopeptidase [Pseudomonadota bacterium]
MRRDDQRDDDPRGGRDGTPALGLIAAVLALVAVPMLLTALRDAEPKFSGGPARLLEAAQAIDRYWTTEFARHYPGASERWRTPRVAFVDVAEGGRHAEDDYAGYYWGHSESIHVDFDATRREGYHVLVLSHEFAHHVQKLAGLSRRLDRLQALSWPQAAEELGMRYELQAECISGVWARAAVRSGAYLSRIDVDRWRAMNVFSLDSSTHGSAEQRLRWFDAGYNSGDASECDTFSPNLRAL